MGDMKTIPEKVMRKKRAPRSNQKLKILYLLKILLEETDEEHTITLKRIVEKLNGYGVSAERKSLYSDIENLRHFGVDIRGFQMERTYHYQIVDRQFQLPEIKLLTDAVQASEFLTKKQTGELTGKLSSYVSRYQAEDLLREQCTKDRVKSRNEKNYYTVDAVHTAILRDQKISFLYFYYDVDKKKVLDHGGKRYVVSPFALQVHYDAYYLTGCDEELGERKIRHFRADRMLDIRILDKKRTGKEAFLNYSMENYPKRLQLPDGGERRKVELLCENGMADCIFSYFSLDTKIIKTDDTHFIAKIETVVDRSFFGFVLSLEGVKVTGPLDVADAMKAYLRKQYAQYMEASIIERNEKQRGSG